MEASSPPGSVFRRLMQRLPRFSDPPSLGDMVPVLNIKEAVKKCKRVWRWERGAG